MIDFVGFQSLPTRNPNPRCHRFFWRIFSVYFWWGEWYSVIFIDIPDWNMAFRPVLSTAAFFWTHDWYPERCAERNIWSIATSYNDTCSTSTSPGKSGLVVLGVEAVVNFRSGMCLSKNPIEQTILPWRCLGISSTSIVSTRKCSSVSSKLLFHLVAVYASVGSTHPDEAAKPSCSTIGGKMQ